MATQLAFTPSSAARGFWGGGVSAHKIELDGNGHSAFPAGTVLQFHADQEIYGDGAEAGLFYKVMSGVVRICKFLDDGRRQIEEFHRDGDMFGFESGGCYRHSAEAVGNCTLVAYRRRCADMAAAEESVRTQIFAAMMRNLLRAQQHMLWLGCKSAVEKVAGFLIDWAAHSADGKSAALEMSRQDIADYLGLTIETVSRMITQLERQGMIELISTRNILLKNIHGLRLLDA